MSDQRETSLTIKPPPIEAYLPSGLPPPSEWRLPKDIKDDPFPVQFDAIAFPYDDTSRIWLTQPNQGEGTIISINKGSQVVRMDWEKPHPLEHAPSWIQKQLGHTVGDAPAWFQKGLSESIDTGNFSPIRAHVAYHLLVYTEGKKPSVWVNTLLLERYDSRFQGPQILASIPNKQMFVKPGTVHSRDTLTISPSRSMALHTWTKGLLVEGASIAEYINVTRSQLGELPELIRQARNSETQENYPNSVMRHLTQQAGERFGIRLENSVADFKRIEEAIYKKAGDRLRSPIS
jgi:hypothetical protein